MVDAYGNVFYCISGTVFLMGDSPPNAFKVRGEENYAAPSCMTWAVGSWMERKVQAIPSVLPAPFRCTSYMALESGVDPAGFVVAGLSRPRMSVEPLGLVRLA